MEDIIEVKMPNLSEMSRNGQLIALEVQFEASMTIARESYGLGLLSLYEIHKRKLYKPEYTDFRLYLKQKWGLKKSKVYAHFQIIEPFHKLIANDCEVDFDRLKQGFRIASVSKTMAQKVFDAAKVNTDEHYNDNLREWQGILPHDQCIHDKKDEVTRTYIYCGKCNKNLGMVEE